MDLGPSPRATPRAQSEPPAAPISAIPTDPRPTSPAVQQLSPSFNNFYRIWRLREGGRQLLSAIIYLSAPNLPMIQQFIDLFSNCHHHSAIFIEFEDSGRGRKTASLSNYLSVRAQPPSDLAIYRFVHQLSPSFSNFYRIWRLWEKEEDNFSQQLFICSAIFYNSNINMSSEI